MSAICGVLRFDRSAVQPGDIDRQLRALAHLGPDGARAICDGVVGLGHGAMTVTHEDRLDAQPVNDAGVLLVADVRLDNRQALATALSIDGAADQLPDSAFLMAAYRRWGAACMEHLVGDFAFAIWDPGQRTLLLARDHMGQRHLFYHRGRDFLAFATEIKGLWALPDTPREMSEAGLARRLLVDGGDAPGATLFEAIEALPGGCALSVGADGVVARQRYWSPQAAAIHLGRDEAYYRRAYREVLAEAVACRLRRTTRPAALLLSGGYDSAAIAALAAPALGGRRLVAVTSASPEGRDDDGPSARRWVELCRERMPHLDVRYVTLEGDILASASRLSLAMDRPSSPNAYALDEVCRAASAAGARVVMDGYGGDYTLNPRGGRPLARFLRAGRLRTFWREFAAQRRWRRESLWTSLKREVVLPLAPGRLAQARARYRAGLPTSGLIHPVESRFAETAIAQGVTPLGQARRPRPSQLRAIALRTLRGAQDSPTLGGLVFGARGLELTQPFHDKRVVELALAIPEDLYFRDGRPRHLARTALADLLPVEFQTPPPGNIPFIPDYAGMIERIEPQLFAEIERLEQNPRLARYFDFARMRRMFATGPRDWRFGESGYRRRQAARTFLCAHYVDRFRRDNG